MVCRLLAFFCSPSLPFFGFFCRTSKLGWPFVPAAACTLVRSSVFTAFGRSRDIMMLAQVSSMQLYSISQPTSHCYSAGCHRPREMVCGWVSSKQLYSITSSSQMSAVRGYRLNSISRLSFHLRKVAVTPIKQFKLKPMPAPTQKSQLRVRAGQAQA